MWYVSDKKKESELKCWLKDKTLLTGITWLLMPMKYCNPFMLEDNIMYSILNLFTAFQRFLVVNLPETSFK